MGEPQKGCELVTNLTTEGFIHEKNDWSVEPSSVGKCGTIYDTSGRVIGHNGGRACSPRGHNPWGDKKFGKAGYIKKQLLGLAGAVLGQGTVYRLAGRTRDWDVAI